MVNTSTLEGNLEEKRREALQVYRTFTGSSNGLPRPKARKVRQFTREHPEEARALVRVYDTQHPNESNGRSLLDRINHFGRSLDDVDKVAEVVEAERTRGYGPIRRFVAGHPGLMGILFVLASGFTIQKGLEYPIHTHTRQEIVQAIHETEDDDHYKRLEDIYLEDVAQKTSEKCGYLTRNKEGRVEFEVTPTINGLMPDSLLPQVVAKNLDRYHFRFPFSPLFFYLQGKEIVSSWHFHCGDEAPSDEDKTFGQNEIILRYKPDGTFGHYTTRYLAGGGSSIFVPDPGLQPIKYSKEQLEEFNRRRKINPQDAKEYLDSQKLLILGKSPSTRNVAK
ncbi:MAG: hypothetical protein WC796_02370 [Candidatus Pacearchaeota archaeon]|jgi:hypothetical protein